MTHYPYILILKKTISLLSGAEKKKLFYLFLGIFSLGLLEMLSIGCIVPVTTLLARPELLLNNSYVISISHFLGATDDLEIVVFIMGMSILVFILANVGMIAIHWYSTKFNHYLAHSLSQKLYKSYLTRNYQYFFGKHISALKSNLLHEVDRIVFGTILPAINICSKSIVILNILALLLMCHFGTTVVLVVIISSFALFFYRIVRQKVGDLGALITHKNFERINIINESLDKIQLTKLYRLEKIYLCLFSKASLSLSKLNSKRDFIPIASKGIIETITIGGGILYMLLFTIRGGDFNLLFPVISLFIFSCYRLMPHLQILLTNMNSFIFNSAAVDSIYDDLDEPNIITDHGAQHKICIQQQVKFKDISFAYQKTKILNNVSIELKLGEIIGVIGKTGAGKSTLVDIVSTLLLPDDGSVLVDDKEISECDFRDFKDNIGIVPQHNHLLDDTIAANIALGVTFDNINTQRMMSAAKLAQIDNFVRTLPEGFNTKVGTGGINLSGGQVQRIAIARALYREAQIIIMDEATSALDLETEKKIISSLRAIANNRIVLMVAHRKSALEACDRLVEVKDGKLVERLAEQRTTTTA